MSETRCEPDRTMAGYGLTTAQIIYRLPDHPKLLQTYIWQDYDIAPDFPEMRGFLRFWREKLDGPLYCVRYSHRRLIGPSEWRSISGEFMLQ
ncbi:MAG TPA: aspartate-semialdehyde dehydrogenase [Pararhizobium sp.]|nr:aspartate-semialdehyde dehydrogenase [Pararhizobium sp.]